jgi:hypothetical protein
MMDVPELTDAQELREIQVSPDVEFPERRETMEELVSQETQEEEETEETQERTVCPEHLEHQEKRERTVSLETPDVTEPQECPDLKETPQPSLDLLVPQESPEQASLELQELRETWVTLVCLDPRVTRERQLTTTEPEERMVTLVLMEELERRVIMETQEHKECLE